MDKYDGTRIGRQELDAEILDDMPGALWTRDMLERAYLRPYAGTIFPIDDFSRIVVGVDPAVSTNPWSDETGIIVVGTRASDDHLVVIADESGRYTPSQWAEKAVSLSRRFHADKIIAEANQGGDMVASTLRAVDPNISIKLVRATKGKFVRAEPVSALYERQIVHHLGSFPQLEDQMCQFTRDMDREKLQFSPDRADALVWAITELKVADGDGTAIIDYYRRLKPPEAPGEKK
jgi:phage terminase large subunit-like protein